MAFAWEKSLQVPGWIGTCTELAAEDLAAFDDTERSIAFNTFARLLGPDGMRELRQRYPGPPRIEDDWAIEFGRGSWKGQPAVCMHHSAIHHLWLIPKDRLQTKKPVQTHRRQGVLSGC